MRSLTKLINTAKTSQSPLQEMSTEILWMKMALSKALEENNESEQGTPSPQPQSLDGANDEFTRIAELLKSSRWLSALNAVRLHRAQWPGDSDHDDDDVTTAVNMFCRHLGQDRSGKYNSLISFYYNKTFYWKISYS